MGSQTVTEAQVREVVAIDRQASCRPRDSTSARSKITSEFDDEEGLIVDLTLSASLSDVTLYDVVEGDDSDFSVAVDIEESSETQKPSSVQHKEALCAPRQARCVSNIPSIATQYSSISHFRTATSSSCSTATSCTTDAKRHAIPWELYEDVSPAVLELHLFPSPFHPQPLAPLLCVGDKQNIVQLMCSALRQRRAVGRADVPVVGILLPESGSTCEVLFGWVEKGPRPGRTLVRSRLCVGGVDENDTDNNPRRGYTSARGGCRPGSRPCSTWSGRTVRCASCGSSRGLARWPTGFVLARRTIPEIVFVVPE